MNATETSEATRSVASEPSEAPVRSSDGLGDIWECFCDMSYYDQWAVRRKKETGWGQCFHMNSSEEAKALTALLNKHHVP